MKNMTGEIRARGRLTIPKKIRNMLNLEDGQAVTFLAIGDSVIISPKRMDLDEARRQIRRTMKEANLTESELLADLRKERDARYRKRYGRRKN